MGIMQVLSKFRIFSYHKINNFMITAEILVRSLANFYRQYADRHMNLNSCVTSASESGQFDHLLS